MRINRKDTPKRITFEEIPTGTTFTMDGRTTVFIKVDMSDFNFYCDRCDAENFVKNDYAVNLETGEIGEFGYRTSVTPINCELNEI